MVSSVASATIDGSGDGIFVDRAMAVTVSVWLGAEVEEGIVIVGMADEGFRELWVAGTQAFRRKRMRIKLQGIFIFIISLKNNKEDFPDQGGAATYGNERKSGLSISTSTAPTLAFPCAESAHLHTKGVTVREPCYQFIQPRASMCR